MGSETKKRASNSKTVVCLLPPLSSVSKSNSARKPGAAPEDAITCWLVRSSPGATRKPEPCGRPSRKMIRATASAAVRPRDRNDTPTKSYVRPMIDSGPTFGCGAASAVAGCSIASAVSRISRASSCGSNFLRKGVLSSFARRRATARSCWVSAPSGFPWPICWRLRAIWSLAETSRSETTSSRARCEISDMCAPIQISSM